MEPMGSFKAGASYRSAQISLSLSLATLSPYNPYPEPKILNPIPHSSVYPLGASEMLKP